MSTELNSQNYALLDLSSKVEYALLALLELACHKEKKIPIPLTMSEITAKQTIPERYLEQILSSLRRGGVVQSQRGSRGGFTLAREPSQITLLEIVISVEGEKKERTMEPATLERNLVYEIWEKANAASIEVLGQYTLQDLCQQREAYMHQSLMYYI